MNQAELQRKRKERERNVKYEASQHRNKVTIHPQNTKKHELKKAEICYNLLQEGKHFITEATFKDKDIRPDIYVLDNGNMIEIETTTYNLEERKEKYPGDNLIIIPLEDEE